MNILIIGDPIKTKEFEIKFQNMMKIHSCVFSNPQSLTPSLCFDKDIVFDLNFDENVKNINIYSNLNEKLIIVSAVKIQLSSLYQLSNEINCILIGLNCLPGFINREKIEISLLNLEHLAKVKEIFTTLEIGYFLIRDQVGMVSPRIICMLINEAFYTLEEGTATKEDIDLSMKLGTNYPYGPFEWAEIIGIGNVWEILDALYMNTGDDRYKTCPLLKHNTQLK